MGYDTDFQGHFSVEPALKPEHVAYLKAFAKTRRVRRDAEIAATLPDPIRKAVGLKVGPEGCYYVGSTDYGGRGVIDGNSPPDGQPGLWCKWEPSDDGSRVEWNGVEKFYDYVEWVEYLIDHFLEPAGYVLNGKVQWQGEEIGDVGVIRIEGNQVSVKTLRVEDDEDQDVIEGEFEEL